MVLAFPFPCFALKAMVYSRMQTIMADRSGYNLSTYALVILVHIYNSLINMGCLHILPHI
jgi:hypothetical protein